MKLTSNDLVKEVPRGSNTGNILHDGIVGVKEVGGLCDDGILG